MKKKVNKASRYTEITNVSLHSVSLPGYGILRAGKTASVDSDLLETTDYKAFRERGILALPGEVVKLTQATLEKEEAKVNALQEKKVVVEQKVKPYIPKSDLNDPPKKTKGKNIKRVGSDEEGLLMNGMEPGEHDGIQFVDIEQTNKKIAEHPILGKLNENYNH
jgi:hypothetical protein